MKKVLIAAFVALSLGGCVNGKVLGVIPPLGSVKNPVSVTRFATIEATYGIALTAANAYADRYRKGNRCTTTRLESLTNLCARRSIVLKMQAADRDARIAMGRAKTFITANPTLDATSLLDAAAAAVSTFQQITQN